MTQEFSEPIHDGQFAGRDIINNIHQNAESVDERLLVLAQRNTLNSLISDIESFGKHTGWDMWRKVHALLGVSSINEIVISQFEKAENFLKKELDQAVEYAACKTLMSLIMTDTQDRQELKNKTNRFSKEQFGTANFYKLSKTQLQEILNYLKEISHQEQPVANSSLVNQILALIKTQSKPVLTIFAVGFVLGVIIF